jgi:hypothetical protein
MITDILELSEELPPAFAQSINDEFWDIVTNGQEDG